MGNHPSFGRSRFPCLTVYFAVLLGLQCRVKGMLHGCHKCSQFFGGSFLVRVWLSQGDAMLPSQDKPRVDWRSRQCGDPGPSPERFWILSTEVDFAQRAPYRAAALLIFHGGCARGPSSSVTAV